MKNYFRNPLVKIAITILFFFSVILRFSQTSLESEITNFITYFSVSLLVITVIANTFFYSEKGSPYLKSISRDKNNLISEKPNSLDFEVFEVIYNDINFIELFSTVDINLKRIAFSQTQVEQIAKENKHFLAKGDLGTFFIFETDRYLGEKLYIACLEYCSDELFMKVFPLSSKTLTKAVVGSHIVTRSA